MKPAPSFLFVCLGNICRSPLALGIALQLVPQGSGVELDSCGTGGWHAGEGACPPSVKVAHRHGIALEHHRARQIRREDWVRFEWLVAMDDSNIGTLIGLGVPRGKILKLGDFGCEGRDVPDPYGAKDESQIEAVYQMIETGVRGLLRCKGMLG